MFFYLFFTKTKTVCTVRTAKRAMGIVGVILTVCDSVYLFCFKMVGYLVVEIVFFYLQTNTTQS